MVPVPSVVLYFQLHQPHRLRRFSVFDSRADYFDEARNAEICRKVAEKCYRPATRLLLDLARRHQGKFRLSFSVSGTALEQLEAHAPDVVQLLRDLAGTGCCEFLGETYYHSLASLYSSQEFAEQIDLHSRKVELLLGARPTVFRNTELIYSNQLAAWVAQMRDAQGKPRFLGCLCEGTDALLDGRPPGTVYTPPGALVGREGAPFGLLLKNYALSDDIAFRFGERQRAGSPLTPQEFAGKITGMDGTVCNLFMDYETFGEHQWADTGIFEFLSHLPEAVLAPGTNEFLTPGEALRRHPPAAVYDVPTPISWADTHRDLSAWCGNAMQAGALKEMFGMEKGVKTRYAAGMSSADPEQRHAAWQLLADWRRLTTSDHYYYMATKPAEDGQVHQYFSPYESPYDSYINFMNVLDHLKGRLGA